MTKVSTRLGVMAAVTTRVVTMATKSTCFLAMIPVATSFSFWQRWQQTTDDLKAAEFIRLIVLATMAADDC